MKQLRWGILSTAKIAQRRMIPAMGNATTAQVAAIASRSLESAQAVAETLGIPKAYGRYEDLLADPDIDAVYNALPNGLHAEWTIKAAQAGKHVLCEKPLANNASEATEMAAACEQHQVLLVEAFMYRHHPRIGRAVELVREGVIGQVRLVRANFSFVLDRPQDPRWDLELGGGALMDVGCYPVNIARLFLGTEPESAVADAVLAPSRVDATLAGVLRFPNDQLAVIDCSFCTPYHQQVDVMGEAGVLTIPRPFAAAYEPYSLTIIRDEQAQSMTFDPANPYTRMVEAFGQTVLDGTPFPFPASDAVANMRAIDLLYQAAGAPR